MSTQPIVGINAHLLSGHAGYRRAGIHQYIAQVLRHLPPDDGLGYRVFTRHADDLDDCSHLEIERSRWPTEQRLARIAWEQTAWPWLARDVDLLHSTAFVLPATWRKPSVVTIYDLSFVHYPENFPALQRRYLTRQTAVACQRATRILTISASGREDVVRFFDVDPQRVDVVVPGVDPAYRVLPEAEVAAFRTRPDVPDQFLLHVGTLQPRKNIPTLLHALALLKRPWLKLVLIGGKGWLYDEIFALVQQLGLAEQVIFPGYVPDAELPLWYNAADLFVFPSVYEGFGMPVVEAQACGTAVVASNVSSIPEAGGEAALYVNPANPSELANRIAAVLDSPAQAATMRAEGIRRARRFSWERAGRETAVVYRSALRPGKS